MADLPSKARAYILFLTALTVSAVLFSFFELAKTFDSWVAVSIVASGIVILDAIPIDLYGEQVEVTLSDTVKFASVLLCPPAVVILGAFLGTLLWEVHTKRSAWVKKLFNISEMTLTWAAVALVYLLLHQRNFDLFDSFQNVLALILSGSTDFLVNSFLVALVISLASKLPLRYVLARNYRQIVWSELSMIPLGVFLAVLWRVNPVSIILAALPLLVVRQSHKIANDLQGQTHDALLALVRVIDERDHHTSDHSDQVAKYAQVIAEALDLPQEEIEVIVPAAQLHDLGKVGMADDILFNPKLLNPEERKSAQQHAEIGAVLLSKFPLFDKGAVLVRHHHERYDGTGYPDNLKGEAIPIGARIIAVADAFQAMTEARPYRGALSREEAIVQLIAGSGTQFDPMVVQAFVRILEGAKQPDPPTPVALPQNVNIASDAS
jgi:HD-GYP domain-containing protein (c-di-GMP phosphodiesterase class II)